MGRGGLPALVLGLLAMSALSGCGSSTPVAAPTTSLALKTVPCRSGAVTIALGQELAIVGCPAGSFSAPQTFGSLGDSGINGYVADAVGVSNVEITGPKPSYASLGVLVVTVTE